MSDTDTSTTTVRPGEIVRVLVHPARNAGSRETTAIVTAVNKDGTAQLQLLLPDSTPRATGKVFASRTEVNAHLAEQFKLLPGHTEDDEGNLVVGTNPRTNREWRDYDVLDWVTPAWPADPHPAVTELQARQDATDARVRALTAAAAASTSSSTSSSPAE